MATYVKSRTGEQCRTHHQKMIQKCHTIDNIIDMIEEKEKKVIMMRNEQNNNLN